MEFENFFEVKQNGIKGRPLYEDLEIPAELNKTRRELFLWLGLEVTHKLDKDGIHHIRDKKGDLKHFIVEAKEKSVDYNPEKYDQYVDKIREFLTEKYETDGMPIGANNSAFETIKDNLRYFNELDVFHESVYYSENDKKILKGYNNSGNSVNHWFPEMVNIRLTKGKGEHYSIFDQVKRKDLFDKKFKRIVVDNKLKIFSKFPGNEKVFEGLSAGLRVVSGAQPVTNIRCPVAKWVWAWSAKELNKFDEFICWDPSMGWAGRLIGFLSASRRAEIYNKRCMYIGTDPNKEIFERYSKITNFWKTRVDSSCKAEIRPLCIGSEEFHNSDEFKEFKGRGAVVYTSPPYFAKERYSQDSEQSYMKFPEYESWKEGFLKQTIKNAYDFLRPGGFFFWNIADVYIGSKKMALEKDSMEIAENIGFEYSETLYQLMKTFPGRDQTPENVEKQIAKGSNFVKLRNPKAYKGGNWKEAGKSEIYQKYEPIYVFKKPNMERKSLFGLDIL